jgi:hypothetical protein
MDDYASGQRQAGYADGRPVPAVEFRRENLDALLRATMCIAWIALSSRAIAEQEPAIARRIYPRI